MATILPIIQIVISVLLIAGILLQLNSAGMGGALGGSDNVDAGYHTRRGAEKWFFNGTIILAILFVIVSIISFVTA
ncbi:MAG TPA: preprotein translocase subunit SecG [Candidatus Paceibacterota bacterium]|nr:preprotein translocase subunit SecG [Candidatus Paceibacterota bacterium]HRZ34637.1 preprotein translocase subunit SecG [Candidatus Paceibacterota bacterium]